MAAIYELKDKTVCPPGGFIFTRKDGTKFEGTYSVGTMEECRAHHGLKDEDAWQKVLHETYSNIRPDAREHFIVKNTEALICQNPTFRYIDRNALLPAPYVYNPGLITVDDEDWLVYRRQMANSDSTACRYSFKTGENHTINLPEIYLGEQFEDPRVFWHDGAVHIVISSWRKQWQYKPLLRLFRLDAEWKVESEIPLTYGGNGKGVTQKNWQFYSHEGQLNFVYQYAPFQVVAGDKVHQSQGLHWKYGEIRGGTPPVRVANHYFTFFHSRLDHGRARYFMGAMAFDVKAPFRPAGMTVEPLMIATNREPSLGWAPLTFFPCGALFKNRKWCVSAGINDLNCGLVDFQHDQLLALMSPL